LPKQFLRGKYDKGRNLKKEKRMFIRSTGLGKTLLKAKVAKIEVTDLVPATLEKPKDNEKEPERILMVLEIVEPVHWTVRAFVEPKDLREMLSMILKRPSVIWEGFKFLFKK
jgi:hypothetical protein